MIISVHTPKCGGSSFRALLENHYRENFIADYSDKPINKPAEERIESAEKFKTHLILDSYKKQNSCIHGHFLPYKYSDLLSLPNVTFITWLRDPLERLASHFHYWKRTENNDNKANFGAFRKKVKKENWSFEKFCLCSELQNIYSSLFYNFPIDQFEFIGITEYFNSEINYFSSTYLNKKIEEIPNRNVNTDKKEAYFKDPKLIAAVKAFHLEDYKIYESALLKRQKRISTIIK